MTTTIATANYRPSTRLTEEEIRRYEAEFAKAGYLLFGQVVPVEMLSNLRDSILKAFDQSKSQGDLFAGGGLMSGHLNCFTGEESRFIYDAIESRGIIDLVRAIAPPATRMPNVGGNLNLPGSVAQHYHTDRPFSREFLIVNTAVVDNDLVNGATEVIPGTHTRFYPYWKFVGKRVARGATRVQMKAGDVMIRSSNLWHRGMPNNSNTPRPMAALTWEDGGSIAEDPFALNEGRITFNPNWFRPTRLGRLRERTFVKAPFLYDTYRIVDSLLTRKGY